MFGIMCCKNNCFIGTAKENTSSFPKANMFRAQATLRKAIRGLCFDKNKAYKVGQKVIDISEIILSLL